MQMPKFFKTKVFGKGLFVLLFSVLFIWIAGAAINRVMPNEKIDQSSYRHSEPIFLPESYRKMPKIFDVGAANSQSSARSVSMSEYTRLHNQQPAHHIITTAWSRG